MLTRSCLPPFSERLVLLYGHGCAQSFRADYMTHRKHVFCVTKTKILRLRYSTTLHNGINLPITIDKGTFKHSTERSFKPFSTISVRVSHLIYGNPKVLTRKTAICARVTVASGQYKLVPQPPVIPSLRRASIQSSALVRSSVRSSG